MHKNDKIKLLSFIIIVGFSIAVFYHYILGVYLGKPYPSNTFLFVPADKFMDFFNVINKHDYLSIKPDPTCNYFPFAYFISNLFGYIKPQLLSFYIFQVLFLGFALWFFGKNLKGLSKKDSITNTFIFVFLSFPVLFTIDRTNFETFIFIFLCLFVYLYQKGKVNYSLIPLSVAIAMKLFPAIFLVLLFTDRKYKQIFWTLSAVVLLSFLSLLTFDGRMGENMFRLGLNLKLYNEIYAIGNAGLDYGNSLFGPIKVVLHYVFKNNLDLHLLLKVYSISVLFLFSLIAFIIIFFINSFWKKIALLVFSMCLFPHVSGDYKLLHIFIPLFLFINVRIEEEFPYTAKPSFKLFKHSISIDHIYIILFGLLLIPKNYRLFVPIYDGVFLDPLIMSVLVMIIISEEIVYFSGGNFREVISKKMKFLFLKA
jgi:hypothetical protein